MVVATIIINPRPEIGSGDTCGSGRRRLVELGVDCIEGFEVPRRLGQHGGFAPFPGHANASLLVGPVVYLIAPLANPRGPGAVVSRVLHVPSIKTFYRFLHAVTSGIAACGRKLLVDDAIKSCCDKTVVSLVELRFPQQNTGVVAVAANHLSRVLANSFAEQLVSHELPAGIGDDGENAKLVARIHEGGILRVMTAIRSETCLTELDCIAVMRGCRQSIADIR